MKPRSTKAKIGLVVAVVIAGLTAVAANFGILSAHRSSPDVGVLTATEVADTSTTVADTTVDPAALTPDTAAPVYRDGKNSHDGDSHDGGKDSHDGDSHKDKRRHDKGHDSDD